VNRPLGIISFPHRDDVAANEALALYTRGLTHTSVTYHKTNTYEKRIYSNHSYINTACIECSVGGMEWPPGVACACHSPRSPFLRRSPIPSFICGLLTLRSLRFCASLSKILGSAADSAAARTASASVALLNFT
jgi:hypothetical protein